MKRVLNLSLYFLVTVVVFWSLNKGITFKDIVIIAAVFIALAAAQFAIETWLQNRRSH